MKIAPTEYSCNEKETEMIGNNKLHLNTETMIQAMQQWIDAKMPHGADTSVLLGNSLMVVGPLLLPGNR